MNHSPSDPATNFSFAPGCALMLYKPALAGKVHAWLNANLGEMDLHLTCCHHDPLLQEPTRIINICPGCDKRFGKDYVNSTTVSLWEVLAASGTFAFPDYGGMRMSILDACPTREKEYIHTTIRSLLAKMNITVVEPSKTGSRGTCCGDSFYGLIPLDKMEEQMKKRASEMPEEDVVVYCVSCVNSMLIGGRKPHYLVDLLFGEETTPSVVEPEAWHTKLDIYIEQH